MFKSCAIRFNLLCLLLVPLILSGGCATRQADCSKVIAAAEHLGSTGQDFDADEACKDAAAQAWQTGLARYCQAQRGFDMAYRGEDQPVQCRQDAFVNAYQHGQILFELQAEQAELEQRIAELEQQHDSNHADQHQQLTRLRNRMITIQRDLPEWLTLARLEGFLAPAAVPDQPATTEQE